MEGNLKLEFMNEKTAKIIYNAITPDDYEAPNFKIKSKQSGKTINVRLECLKIGSLMETLDDLLSCVQMAEKTIENLKESSPHKS